MAQMTNVLCASGQVEERFNIPYLNIASSAYIVVKVPYVECKQRVTNVESCSYTEASLSNPCRSSEVIDHSPEPVRNAAQPIVLVAANASCLFY